jgi:hypothetical protein
MTAGQLPDPGQVDVPGHDQQGPRRPKALGGEPDDIVSRDRAIRGGGGVPAVGMRAVQLGGVEPAGDRLRLGQRELVLRDETRPGQVHLGLGEGRVPDDVPQQLEGEVRVVGEHPGGDREEVVVGSGADRPPGTLDRLGDLLGRPRLRALGQHLGDDLAQPGLVGGLVHAPGAEREADRHRRLLVVFHHDHVHAVGEAGLLEGGEPHRAERGRCRRPRRVATLGREGAG